MNSERWKARSQWGRRAGSAAIVVVVMVLAACTFASQTPVPDAADAIELHLLGWAGSEADNERLTGVLDDFHAANPNVTVALTLTQEYDARLKQALNGSSPPDVIFVDSFTLPDLVKAGQLLPADGKLTAVDDFYLSLRSAFTLDGTLYCPPKEFSTLALIYNKGLFDRAQLAYPTADWTWQDLRSAAEKLTDLEQGVYGLALSPDFARWSAFLYQAGGAVTDDDLARMTINSTQALDAIKFYAGLVADGFAAQPADLRSGWGGDALGKTRVAMTVEGNWIVPYLKDQYPEVSVGVSELPAGPAGRATIAFATCFAVTAKSTHQDAAFRLVDYLTGSAAMEALTDDGVAMPPRASLRAGWLEKYPDLEPFLNGSVYARRWQFGPVFQPVVDEANAALQQLFADNITAEELLSRVESAGNQALGR